MMLVVALVIGLVAGLAGAFLLGRSSGDDDEAQVAQVTASETRDGDREAFAELPAADAVIGVEQATDPETALRGFLAAEATGDWEASYAFLTDVQQEVAFPSPALWVNEHANIPTVTGYRIDDVQVDDQTGTATVTTLTGFEPQLDPVRGLVAARGRTTWVVEQADDGTWRVDTAATTNQPLYPDSGGAAEAAQAWVDARVDCQDTTDLEQGLIGSPALAGQLCEQQQPDTVTLGEVGPLTDSADTSALLSRFGPEVFGWARAVRVEAATPLTVVLAPIGQDWRVVAILPG